jgi:hypothetical protein
VGYRREQAYQDDDETAATLCTPVGTGPTETCISGFFAPPKKSSKGLAYAEYRGAFLKQNRQRWFDFAISPRVTRDTDDNVWALDMPIYLLRAMKDGEATQRTKKPPFTGGIRLGWRDDTSDLTVSIFVSSAFDLLGE